MNEIAGDQTWQTVSATRRETDRFARTLRSSRGTPRVLADLTQLGVHDGEARRASFDALRESKVDRVAIFGGPGITGIIAGFLIRAAGRGDSVRYFPSRESAEAWLAELVIVGDPRPES